MFMCKALLFVFYWFRSCFFSLHISFYFHLKFIDLRCLHAEPWQEVGRWGQTYR